MLFLFSLAFGAGIFFVLYNLRNTNPSQAQQIAPIMKLVGAGSFLVAVAQCFTVVPAGNVGVVDFFGTVSNMTLKAGINIVNPLAKIVKMSIKTQEVKELMEVPSKGLTVQLEVSFVSLKSR